MKRVRINLVPFFVFLDHLVNQILDMSIYTQNI